MNMWQNLVPKLWDIGDDATVSSSFCGRGTKQSMSAQQSALNDVRQRGVKILPCKVYLYACVSIFIYYIIKVKR